MFFFFWDSTVFETKTSFHPDHELVQLLGTDFFALAEESSSYTYASMPAEVLKQRYIQMNIGTAHQIKTGKDGLSVVIIFCVYVHIYIIYILCVCLLYLFIHLFTCTHMHSRYISVLPSILMWRILTFFHMNVQCVFRTSTTNATRHGEVGLSSQWDGSPLRPGGWLPHAMSLLGHCGSI